MSIIIFSNLGTLGNNLPVSLSSFFHSVLPAVAAAWACLPPGLLPTIQVALARLMPIFLPPTLDRLALEQKSKQISSDAGSTYQIK